MSHHVSHISGRMALSYHLLTTTADFSWLIAIISTYYSVDPVYLMASQDLISQFSQDTNVIPASQPDRSRTPHRPQHGWHQTVPTFRGPMHFAMTTPRPFWHPAGIPPPPPTSYIVLITPNMDSTHTTFPTYPADVLSTTSQPRKFHTSTTSSYPEIAETYVIPWRKLCHQ